MQGACIQIQVKYAQSWRQWSLQGKINVFTCLITEHNFFSIRKAVIEIILPLGKTPRKIFFLLHLISNY